MTFRLYSVGMETDVVGDEKTDHDQEMTTAQGFKSPDQISDELVTLSLLPESRWRSLVNLEVIKVRYN